MDIKNLKLNEEKLKNKLQFFDFYNSNEEYQYQNKSHFSKEE